MAAPNADREAPTGDSCSELDEYFDFMDTSVCQSPVTDAIRALGYFCGCPETEVSLPSSFGAAYYDGSHVLHKDDQSSKITHL